MQLLFGLFSCIYSACSFSFVFPRLCSIHHCCRGHLVHITGCVCNFYVSRKRNDVTPRRKKRELHCAMIKNEMLLERFARNDHSSKILVSLSNLAACTVYFCVRSILTISVILSAALHLPRSSFNKHINLTALRIAEIKCKKS